MKKTQAPITPLVITSEKGGGVIAAGMEASMHTAHNLDALVEAANQSRNAARQISISTQQQKIASDQVVIALREIVTASAQTAQAIESVSRISNDMSTMSLELSKLIQHFRLKAPDMGVAK